MPLDLVQELTGHTDRVWTTSWNPSGTLLATGGGDKTIRIWAGSGSNWKCVSILTETHNKSIRRLCWSPCGRFLASASFDATVCIWAKSSLDDTWTVVCNLEGHESEVKSVAWSHDGIYLATCGRDRSVMIWERAEDVENLDEEKADGLEWDCSDVKTDHTKDVKHIVWHPNHNILVSCSYDDTIKFFHKQGTDWKCFDTLTSHTSTVWSADFCKTGEFLATCSDDRTVRFWKNTAHDKLPQVESNSWKCVSVVQGYQGRTIYDVSWNRTSDLVVSVSGDNSVVFLEKSTSEGLQTSDILFACVDKVAAAHDCDINCVSWNPGSDKLLATGSDDRKVKLWSHRRDVQGKLPLTIEREILESLEKLTTTCEDINNDGPSKCKRLSFQVDDMKSLLNLMQSFQTLQDQTCHDDELRAVKLTLNLETSSDHPVPINIEELVIEEEQNLVAKIVLGITDARGTVQYQMVVCIDQAKFKLSFPRRCAKLILVAKRELFLFEKTGDLYKVEPSGQSQFLLGHLFMLADVKFVLDKHGNISYIISIDRDEKIRISNYPQAYDIERFCFGHKHFVRRIILVDQEHFISIDKEDNALLWDINQLRIGNGVEPMRAIKSFRLYESEAKRKNQPGNVDSKPRAVNVKE